MFYQRVDRSAPKNTIRDWLMILAADADRVISKAKADKLAQRFKQGTFDPELLPVTEWSDPTGETAVANVMREQAN